MGGLPLYQNISVHNNSISNRIAGGLSHNRKGSPKAGISALKQSTRTYNNNTVTEKKPQLGIYSDSTPKSEMPQLNNKTLGLYNSSSLGGGGLGGGGLSRASGMSLGRHQI